jgi:hypothetical protein
MWLCTWPFGVVFLLDGFLKMPVYAGYQQEEELGGRDGQTMGRRGEMK